MFFDSVPEGQPDAVFGMAAAFHADNRPQKVDLMVGIYRDEHLKSELFPSVRRAQELVSERGADYLPMDGLPDFCDGVGALAFGEELWGKERGRIAVAQTLGGTGALRVGAEFFLQEVAEGVCVPDPTWPNHQQIFERARCRVDTYSYYNFQEKKFDCEAACRRLRELPEKTVVLFHAVCHNPTGCDPTIEEWRRLSEVCRERRLLPFFDFAYQGFGAGLAKDAEAIRLFMREGHEMLVAYSCSKNFSLYCQRVGALFVVAKNGEEKSRIGSQIRRIIRASYSNPPAHGARIVQMIFSDPGSRKNWEKELEAVRLRIVSLREELVRRLGGQFEYLRGRAGLFMYIHLDPKQVRRLIDDYGVYLLENGRMNIAGLTMQNIDSVADAILTVSRS